MIMKKYCSEDWNLWYHWGRAGKQRIQRLQVEIQDEDTIQMIWTSSECCLGAKPSLLRCAIYRISKSIWECFVLKRTNLMTEVLQPWQWECWRATYGQLSKEQSSRRQGPWRWCWRCRRSCNPWWSTSSSYPPSQSGSYVWLVSRWAKANFSHLQIM